MNVFTGEVKWNLVSPCAESVNEFKYLRNLVIYIKNLQKESGELANHL